jgi:hypothetical protein
LKSARDKEDAEGMKKILSELDEVSQDLGKAVYEKSAQAGGAAGAGDPPGGGGGEEASEKKSEKGKAGKEGKDETIIDADYEVKD